MMKHDDQFHHAPPPTTATRSRKLEETTRRRPGHACQQKRRTANDMTMQVMPNEQSSFSLGLAAAAAAAILCPLLVVAFAASTSENNSKSSNRSAKLPPRNTRNDTSRQYGNGKAQKRLSSGKLSASVPFFYVPSMKAISRDNTCISNNEPPFADLIRSLDKYRTDTSAFLASMTRMHEVARRSEWVLFGNIGDSPDHPLLAASLRDKIGWIAECLERDYATLESLMKPFDVTIALPPPSGDTNDDEHDLNENNNTPNYRTTRAEETRYTSIPGRSRRASEDDVTSYDSAAQVITHIVRDWTSSGAKIRSSLYDWCIDMLRNFVPGSAHLPVLVPGSGLGRLAYDISSKGYSVEANDVSVSMAAVTYQFLNGHVQKGIIHPFCFDFLVNEVDSDRRYDSVAFPDVDLSGNSSGNANTTRSISYTLGDFAQTYSSPQRKGQYGAVVTCFFIDTATNIYEYLAIVRSVLGPGGVWINVGPVQWHQNSLIQPSVDQLRLLIEGFGFDIQSWAVDTEAVNYRHDEDRHDKDKNSRYTKSEAYLPIRFVARRGSSRAGGSTPRQDTDRVVSELRQISVCKPASTSYIGNEQTKKDDIVKDECIPFESNDDSKEDENGSGGYVFVDESPSVVIEEVS